MAIAFVQGGVVVAVDRTTDDEWQGWVKCGPDVAPGMLYANGEFAAPERDARSVILAQIAALEARVTPRRAREAILTDEGHDWLADIDAEIEALRGLL